MCFQLLVHGLSQGGAVAQVLARYDEILAELNQVLNLSIGGAMGKVGTTITLTQSFREELESL